MIARVYLRFRTGTPRALENVPSFLKILAKISHFTLYSLLFIMPLSGFLGGFFKINLAIFVHQFSSKILIILILFHICAAIFQEGVLGNKVLSRMLNFGKADH
jgi:cytochrome b561